MSDQGIPVKEIGELLDMVSNKVPGLLREIQNTIFSEDGAASMSNAVGIFYKNLLNAGMDKNDAMDLTREYMETLRVLGKQLKDS